jgi:restriction endonuclease S subunit
MQLTRLGDVAHINPRFDKSSLADDVPVSFVQMASVGASDGKINVSIVRPFAEVKKGSYTPFKDGDVLFAKVTPCMENGKMAIAHGLMNGVGFGSSEFHVLRPSDQLDAKYLYYFVSSQAFRKEAAGHMTGAVGLRRVPAAFLADAQLPMVPLDEQRRIVAEIEKQFSRLDEAVANLQRVKANLKRYERATIASLTNPESFDVCVDGSIADVAISLDNMRKPVNKLERAKRPGNIPYLGANGQTGWIDVPLFDEELVLVVEDETFVGRTEPFCYYFADPCWVNNHTHVLRARPEVVSAKYLNLALSYYPFVPLTTGSTGRRKLTKAALMTAPISVPSLTEQTKVVNEVERCMSISREIEIQVELNLKRAMALRQATLSKAFGTGQ